MSTNENVPETVEEQVVKKAEVQRRRNKRSMDLAIEESAAITKSLGAVPDLTEGRRRTRSGNTSITSPNTSDAAPPAKKQKISNTPKTGRGRGRKARKIIVESDNLQETTTNNEVVIEKPEASVADKVDTETNGHIKESEIQSENDNGKTQSEPEPEPESEPKLEQEQEHEPMDVNLAGSSGKENSVSTVIVPEDSVTLPSADEAESLPQQSEEHVVPSTEEPKAVAEENGKLNNESQEKIVVVETAPVSNADSDPGPVPVSVPETKNE